MVSDRDTLTYLLLDCEETAASPRETADYLIEQGWRPPAQVIADPAELDTLPVAAVILAGGQAWQGVRTPVGSAWRLAGGSTDRTSKYVLSVFGDATVLHIPPNKAGI